MKDEGAVSALVSIMGTPLLLLLGKPTFKKE
jgi:hypothetical protein